MTPSLASAIHTAVADQQLLPAAAKNIEHLLAASASPLAQTVIEELAQAQQWQELNDRFFKRLAFGTGGLRGRTIGRIISPSEQGKGGPNDRPEFPCIGSATMNHFNINRAIRGLVTYVKQSHQHTEKPSIVIAHDTRHFSQDFAQYCAKIASDLGCNVTLFDGPRSTPQLSFAVRNLRANAGIVLTASHNPSHDNGFKVYFNDGAQIVEPHASSIIHEVNAISHEAYQALPQHERGTITTLGADFDALYSARLHSLLLKPELLKNTTTRVVVTNLHGTGGHIIVPMLRHFGFDVHTVPAQDIQDGRFPTVESPNPENAPALQMATDLAREIHADLVIGTDPDSDRMGVAVRDANREMQLLTGNQIGSLLAWYRIKTCFDLGWLNDTTRNRAILVKTFVTTELQATIAHHFGIGIVDTLTGFKYIAGKLRKYESAIPQHKLNGRSYRDLNEQETRTLRLEYSRFFIFGGEESYGYLGSDSVRDKDANGAAIMFAEVAAYAQSQNKSILNLLDEIYTQFGYHLELGKSLTMEGADGAARIQALAKSYAKNPPTEVDGTPVSRIRDFAHQDLFDQEGDALPKENMLFVELTDGRRFAVRPSGTEPKIKFYLFANAKPTPNLESAKSHVKNSLANLWSWIEADAKTR